MKMLVVFTQLFREVCAPFNISVPIVGSNSSVDGTNVTYPSPSPSIVSTSEGGKKVIGFGVGWVGSVVLMIVVALSATLL